MFRESETGVFVKKIIVENLQKKQNTFTIDGVSFLVHESEIFALCGAAGSGKTLVTKLMESLAIPHGGTVTLDKSNAGMVIADQKFYPQKTVYQTLRHHIRLGKKWVRYAQVMNILNIVGLRKARFIKVKKLDPNHIARLKIAVALVAKPSVLILDEPFINMLSWEAREIRVTLKTLADRFKVAILITAPDFETIEEICDTIAVIENGAIMYIKSYNDIMKMNEAYSKICVTTPKPNLAAKTIKNEFKYEVHLFDNDVIVDAHPDNAQVIYDKLKEKEIEVSEMSHVNKSIRDLFYDRGYTRESAQGYTYTDYDAYDGGAE